MKEANRDCGVLLHITSLPGPYGIGEIGKEAMSFIDKLHEMDQRFWQFLPTNYPALHNSPYDTNSAFAQNPLLLSMDSLIKDGLLNNQDLKKIPSFNHKKVEFEKLKEWKLPLLDKAVNNFLLNSDQEELDNFHQFCQKNDSWLESYALFMVIKELQKNSNWSDWETKYRNLDVVALKEISKTYDLQIKYIKVLQFLFYKQWIHIREYAKAKNVQLIGDVPIYVSYNSADVWANQKLFRLNEDGKMKYQSGCPPDLWSDTGQAWGHPTYNWEAHEQTKFTWWIDRIDNLMNYVDIIRIDHFNGFAKYWEVNASDSNGVNGKWLKGKGDQLFKIAFSKLDGLNLIAEDLGDAWKDAAVLRNKYSIPGMHILQFSFHDNNPFDNMENNMVAYTGTHDNDTLIGFYQTIDNKSYRYLQKALLGRDSTKQILDFNDEEINWRMVEYCLKSNASMVIVPMQDILCLGSNSRMNTPATVSDKNWTWRIDISKLTNDRILKMKMITKNTGRS